MGTCRWSKYLFNFFEKLKKFFNTIFLKKKPVFLKLKLKFKTTKFFIKIRYIYKQIRKVYKTISYAIEDHIELRKAKKVKKINLASVNRKKKMITAINNTVKHTKVFFFTFFEKFIEFYQIIRPKIRFFYQNYICSYIKQKYINFKTRNWPVTLNNWKETTKKILIFIWIHLKCFGRFVDQRLERINLHNEEGDLPRIYNFKCPYSIYYMHQRLKKNARNTKAELLIIFNIIKKKVILIYQQNKNTLYNLFPNLIPNTTWVNYKKAFSNLFSFDWFDWYSFEWFSKTWLSKDYHIHNKYSHLSNFKELSMTKLNYHYRSTINGKNFYFMVSYLYSNMVVIVSLFIVYYLISNNNIIFFKLFYKQLMVLILVYLLFSSFVHLNKTNQYGKYTSANQRFWKRSYLIFWYLEFFLFGLFIYLTLIHFSESPYFLDWKYIYNIMFDNSINFFYFLFLINFILICNYLMFFYFKFNNLTMVSLLLLLILLIFFTSIYYEFSKFFYVLNFFNDSEMLLKTVQNKTNTLSYYTESELINKTRTVNYYISLFILLKFWHIIFIAFHFFFFVRKYLSSGTLSVDLMSSNYQNFLYLFWFNILSMFMFFKNIFIFLSQFSYYWFFVNLNYTNFFFFLTTEIINFINLFN